jgi:hypothetical protein
MIEIKDTDEYFLIKENDILIKIKKNKFEIQIINKNEEIIIDKYDIKMILNIINNSYISFCLYNECICFNNGYNIINDNKYYFTTSEIQKKGVMFTNSIIECDENHICKINYNSFIINKILKKIKNFFLNKLNMSYNEFIELLNKYNITLYNNLFHHKINNSIQIINLQELFIT